ncbi:DUF5949 family protein [Streptomyces swartbergensis]|uniref:Uncharacterized protein n=1 Tax=Streptomyces swartbergensis TaxID=487165 RepID=A0A243S2A0_9ACTN|nr:DUF5949 family protein [Streptomyces swartbergensis]OUD01703.1 hypothetical protein CA983_18765 [Streptomyces swartbergensis]
MTSVSPETQSVHTDDLGSLVVLSWRGTTPDGDVPYLLACSPGDGANGPEATSKAIEQVLTGGDVETPAAFTSDEDLLSSAAHVVLPARSLRS